MSSKLWWGDTLECCSRTDSSIKGVGGGGAEVVVECEKGVGGKERSSHVDT